MAETKPPNIKPIPRPVDAAGGYRASLSGAAAVLQATIALAAFIFLLIRFGADAPDVAGPAVNDLQAAGASRLAARPHGDVADFIELGTDPSIAPRKRSGQERRQAPAPVEPDLAFLFPNEEVPFFFAPHRAPLLVLPPKAYQRGPGPAPYFAAGIAGLFSPPSAGPGGPPGAPPAPPPGPVPETPPPTPLPPPPGPGDPDDPDAPGGPPSDPPPDVPGGPPSLPPTMPPEGPPQEPPTSPPTSPPGPGDPDDPNGGGPGGGPGGPDDRPIDAPAPSSLLLVVTAGILASARRRRVRRTLRP